nr:dna polymerase epsilon subunit b [Quercus suber]
MSALEKPPEDPAVFSSSPGFGTPVHPFPPTQPRRPPPPPAFTKPAIPTILPILLPPPTLRPLAFRAFTKKQNLTLNSQALQALASFVGRLCGSGWREEGTGEKVLEEVAKLWKAESGPIIVDDGVKLQGILRTLEGCMSGGRIGAAKTGKELTRQSSFAFGNDSAVDLSSNEPARPTLDRQGSSFGLSGLHVQEEDDHEDVSKEPRAWLKVISAFDQPRFSYNLEKKHFVQITSKPSLFPQPMQKVALFRERYHVIHQRLLRNAAFQAPTFASNVPTLRRSDSTTAQQFYKITPIANLLGRGATSHLLLGMLVIAPTGALALNDLSGSIPLDLQHAQPLQGKDSAFFCPGMIVLVDGVYEEDWVGAGSSGLGSTGGIGGTIGGRFLGFSIGGPPVEKRNVSLGIDLAAGDVGGGFGWTDFLGLGADRAVGSKMRRLEQTMLRRENDSGGTGARNKMIILSDVTLNLATTLTAVRKVLEHYNRDGEDDAPMSFVLTGNFCSQAGMAGAAIGSIECKEMFDELAVVLSDFPILLRSSTWVFVPGDNDPWAAAFTAGASTTIPRGAVPDLFTSRIKRAFAASKSEVRPASKHATDGEAVWTSNPTRLSLFGSAHEVVVFRDDLASRFRRNAVRVGQATKAQDGDHAHPAPTESADDVTMSGALPSTEDTALVAEDSQMTEADTATTTAATAVAALASGDDYTTAQAKKLILSLLPQSTLSPFPLATRAVHWDYSSALSLYPLPHTLVLADAEAEPYSMTFEGCHVVNPGKLVSGGGRQKKVQWCEYDALTKRGTLKSSWIG